MKYTTFYKAAFVTGALLIAAACAQSAEDIPLDPASSNQTTTPPETAKLPPPSNSAKPAPTTPVNNPPPPAKACAATCKTDSDCSSTCPITSGTACCDVATSTCYNSQQACVPAGDSGTPPPAY